MFSLTPGIYDTFVPLVTPLGNSKSVCERSVQNIIRRVPAEVKGVIPCLSTGEGQFLNADQWQSMLSYSIEYSRKLYVIAGVLRSTTDKCIELCRLAQSMGANGVIVSSPFGSQISPRQMIEHYRAIHDAVEIGLWIYHESSVSKNVIPQESLIEISKFDRVIAIKDSSELGEIVRNQRRFRKSNVMVYRGMENQFMGKGPQAGNIVSLSNLEPEICIKAARSEIKPSFQQKIGNYIEQYCLDRNDWYRHIKAELRIQGEIETDQVAN